MFELPRVLWTVFLKSRDIIQTVGKNLDQKYFFISAKNHFENIFRNLGFQNFHRKNQKCWKSKMFDENEIWSKNRKCWFSKFSSKKPKFWIFKISNFFIFPMKILKTKIFVFFFKIFFRWDEKIFLVQIFFCCLDYISRLQKNCSEYSGKLKHASAMDSVLKLSLKMMGNRWMFRRCSPIIYTCLTYELQ